MPKAFSQNDHAASLARYLPEGRVFAAAGIPGTNANALLQGLAAELVRLEALTCALGDETLPDQDNTLFLAEWERALGLPDECFTETVTLADSDRARHIATKLAALGVQTVEDFETVGAAFGVPLQVTPATDVSPWPPTLPASSEPSAADKRFTILVKVLNVLSDDSWNWVWDEGPTVNGHTWASSGTSTLQCLFQKLKPANCQLFFDVS